MSLPWTKTTKSKRCELMRGAKEGAKTQSFGPGGVARASGGTGATWVMLRLWNHPCFGRGWCWNLYIAYSHKKWQTLDSEFFDKFDPLISSQLFFLAWSLHVFPVECFLVRSSHHLYMQFCPEKSHFTPYFLVFLPRSRWDPPDIASANSG